MSTSAPSAVQADFGGFGGFGGAVPSAPSAPGMGISPASSESALEALPQNESQATVLPQLSLMPLGRITLPKGAVAQHAVMRQPLPYKRVCFWAVDLTQQRTRSSYYLVSPRSAAIPHL
jgi:hypothetical protein